jgi:hypothetical protein
MVLKQVNITTLDSKYPLVEKEFKERKFGDAELLASRIQGGKQVVLYK